jgi:hypothetical protein
MSKQNKPKRPVYNLEFKQDAAKLVIEKGYTQPASGKNLTRPYARCCGQTEATASSDPIQNKRHSETPSSHLGECYEASTEFTMVVAKWHVRRTSGAPKASIVKAL